MSEAFDFERQWLDKFSACLARIAGEEVRDRVMAGWEGQAATSGRQETLAWTREAMERLEDLVSERQRREIMTGCACQYPKADLQKAREAYEATGEIDQVHEMLQRRFESFLAEGLQLDGALIDEVVRRGWGLAGVREGDRIIATKIPKSGFLAEYLAERDPEARRQYYCHCPRVRDALGSGVAIPATYCYCGAGYYKGIWEEILQQPVEVELLASVLQGDEVCQVAIHLPGGKQRKDEG